MRGGEKKQGYTIVEVMVFLAVSGVMFIMAANFIAGKQEISQFRQGMNDINSQVKQTINDVSNGFYPSRGNFACSAGPGLYGALSFGGPVNNEQGANQGCAFIGKVMQFSVGSTDSSAYNVYTVLGRQFQTDASTLIPPANFHEAVPVAATSAPDLTESKALEWGLRVDKMYQGDAASHSEIGALGFFTGFNSSSDDTLASGTATPVAYYIPGSALGQPKSDINHLVSDLGAASNPAVTLALSDSSPLITLCFVGGAHQFGRLTIGSSDTERDNQRLTTHIQISTGGATGLCSL